MWPGPVGRPHNPSIRGNCPVDAVAEMDLAGDGVELVNRRVSGRVGQVIDPGPHLVVDPDDEPLAWLDGRIEHLEALIGRTVADRRRLLVVPWLSDALSLEGRGPSEHVLPGSLGDRPVPHPVGLARLVELVADLPSL